VIVPKGSQVSFDVESVSSPARVANPDEGISADELQLAARNHGMPLESLRWDITPPGLHYLLIHYDIPAIDPSTFDLIIDGLVDTPLSLDLESIKSRPRVSSIVTLECAGNGRAQLAVGGRRHRPLDRYPAGGLAARGGNCRWRH
jgi:sulfane dehydrogenase subunit SoxC